VRRERRRRAMIAAARTLFVERGYEAVSLSEIVRQSGGSLSTLYELFENKLGLLGAIVAEQRFEKLERVDAIIAADCRPAVTLRAIADTLHAGFTDPGAIGLMRLVMAETLRDPGFGHALYKAAHLPAVERLTALLTRWAAEGQATIAHPTIAAEFFLGLTIHWAQTRALFGENGACGSPPAPPEQMLNEAIVLFLQGYGIAPE
jgi:AcrR family transcriptional regulator